MQPPIPATTLTKNMLSKLRMDPVSDIILYDHLVRFAEWLSMKGKCQNDYSRNALRELARLIEKLRELCKNLKLNLKWMLDPMMYHNIVKATKILSQGRPLALRLGHNLIAVVQMFMPDTLTLDHNEDTKM
jgi:hypothetical protein